MTGQPLSLYVHLPFCEARCTYCGCMTIITRRREVAATISGLPRTRDRDARERAATAPAGRSASLGRRHADLSERRADRASARCVIARHFDIAPVERKRRSKSIRASRRAEQLRVLRSLGFNRLSMGVQDFTPEVQEAIGRHQSGTARRASSMTTRAAIGFDSDQPRSDLRPAASEPDIVLANAVNGIAMRPNRIAVYSYAHVPWLRPHQKPIDVSDLPQRDAELRADGRGD